MIELHTLGTAEICTGKARLTPSQNVVFAACLYLIVERGAPVRRKRLASLLWADIPPDETAHRLRQTVYQLKTLGVSVQADRDILRLPRDSAISDFERIASAGVDLPDDCDSVSILPDYAPRLSDQFEKWLDSFRERVHSDLTRVLIPKLRVARAAGNWQEVERVSRLCLSLDPYNEAGVLARAEAFAMRGQKATAVSILDAYVEDVGPDNHGLAIPANILRRRVLQSDDRSPNRATVSMDAEFVGRQAEMAAVTQLMANARKGFGGGCIINGEPGIGKTRLSTELANFAELQGLRVEWISCKRPDTDQPLSAFVALVHRLRELPGALGCSHSTLGWLKRLTEVDGSSSELGSPGEDSATLYTHVRLAVFDLLDAVSDENCLLIIVEDIHWIDHASAKLFGAVLEWASSRKILFLFNARDIPNPLTAAFGTQRITTVHLKPLASDEATTLVHRILSGVTPDSQELSVNWLIKAGDGNPYFLQELAKFWIESGEKRDVPPSIAAVLDERLARLSPIAHQLLQACAVLGEHCNLERLEQVFTYSPQDLLAGTQELSRTGMLRSNQLGEESSQSLLIRHDLLSIEVLNTLAPTSLAFLHRRCGTVLEREVLGPSISISLMRACAFHWHHSGDSERAYGLAIKCADYLLEIGLAGDAATAFEGALGFAADLKRQLEVLHRLIQAYQMAADRLALVATIKRLRTLEDSLGPHSHHDDIEILELEALKTTEVDLLPVLERTVACIYDRSLPAAHRVNAAVTALKLSTTVADLEEVERVYGEVRPLFADPTVDFRSQLQIQVIYHTMCGDLRRGLEYAKERLSFERVQGLTQPLLNAMSDLAFVLRRTGPPEEMLATFREMYATAIDRKDYALARDCAEKLGSVLEDEGLPGSEEWMNRALENGQFSAEIHGSFSFNADSARIALRGGRLDEARRILDHGLDWEWLRSRQMWLAAAHGLRIRLLIGERASASEVSPHVSELQSTYRHWAPMGRQDYEMVALIQGMVYTGAGAQAMFFLDDFIRNTRRDLAPISPELRLLAEEFQIGMGEDLPQLPPSESIEADADNLRHSSPMRPAQLPG